MNPTPINDRDEEKNRVEGGTLYLVATPIGNLSDLSPRAVKVLGEVDFIAAEDTRNTAKLLACFEIRKPMASYFEHNKRERGEVIAARLADGESCALVTDAGTPAISDPGEDLVALCAERGIPVSVVPGPCAAVSALAVSGLFTAKFVFEGFLSTATGERRESLERLKSETRTILLYEAPHKLRTTLADLEKALGDRKISLCRELTKLHEDIWKTTLGEAVEHYKANEPRGEYVLVMAGAPETADPEQELTLEQAAQRALELIGQGLGPTAAAKAAAQGTPYSKSEVYKQLLVLQQGQQAGE